MLNVSHLISKCKSRVDRDALLRVTAQALDRFDAQALAYCLTARFGSVTAEFGNVTDHFGDVTDEVLIRI